jgi:hypothetical protein
MTNNMKELEHPDSFHLNAAVGWLGLGDPVSALKELEQISADNQEHLGVLFLRYEICAAAKNWDLAAVVSETLTKTVPDDPNFWICYAYSTRRKTGGGIPEAKEILLSAEPKFPDEYPFAFNLACYTSQLHQFDETEKWLKKAVKIAESKVKRMVIEDEDMKPFWDSEIGTAWKWE